MKIGITGSIASGKTTASKILSYRRGPLFSADKVVKSFYKNSGFKKLLVKKFKIRKKSNLKNSLKKSTKGLSNAKNTNRSINQATAKNDMDMGFSTKRGWDEEALNAKKLDIEASLRA